MRITRVIIDIASFITTRNIAFDIVGNSTNVFFFFFFFRDAPDALELPVGSNMRPRLPFTCQTDAFQTGTYACMEFPRTFPRVFGSCASDPEPAGDLTVLTSCGRRTRTWPRRATAWQRRLRPHADRGSRRTSTWPTCGPRPACSGIWHRASSGIP